MYFLSDFQDLGGRTPHERTLHGKLAEFRRRGKRKKQPRLKLKLSRKGVSVVYRDFPYKPMILSTIATAGILYGGKQAGKVMAKKFNRNQWENFKRTYRPIQKPAAPQNLGLKALKSTDSSRRIKTIYQVPE